METDPFPNIIQNHEPNIILALNHWVIWVLFGNKRSGNRLDIIIQAVTFRCIFVLGQFYTEACQNGVSGSYANAIIKMKEYIIRTYNIY